MIKFCVNLSGLMHCCMAVYYAHRIIDLKILFRPLAITFSPSCNNQTAVTLCILKGFSLIVVFWNLLQPLFQRVID